MSGARERAGVLGGGLALAAGLGLAVHAWTARGLFPHAGVADPPRLDLALLVVLGFGLVAGLTVLRHRAPGALAAGAGVALLLPFAVDALLFPLPGLAGSAAVRRGVFLGLSGLALLAAATATVRALAAQPVRPPAAWRAPARRAAGRVALAAGSLALAWGAAEAALALAGAGARNYSRPLLIVPGDERRVPLSEVALFRPFDGPAGAQGLSTRFRPYLFLKGWYDRPRWAYFDAGGHVDYVFNRYGLRDHDFELERAPGEWRAVAIGDSFTFGVGVQLEDTWTEVAERGLRERLQRPVQVINAGFASGYHAAGYEEWILRDGLRLQPHAVLIGLCLNDLHPGVSLYAWEPPRRLVQWAGGRSRVLNAVQEAAAGPPPPRRTVDWDALVRAEPAQWEACQAALRRLHEQLGARGVRLVVVPFPMPSGLREQPYPYQALLERVAAFCDAEGIERVDLLPRLLGLDDESLWVHPTDQHPNDVGQRLLGEGVAEYLARPR